MNSGFQASSELLKASVAEHPDFTQQQQELPVSSDGPQQGEEVLPVIMFSIAAAQPTPD